MKNFHYSALDAQGKKVKGFEQAETPKALRQALRQRGLIPIEISEKSNQVFWLQSRVPQKAVILMTRQLATLLEADIPLSQALEAIVDQTENLKAKECFIQIRAKVMEGFSLSDALRLHPNVFSHLYISSIAAAESAGDLSQVLTSLAQHLEETHKMKSKITQALIYPSFVISISIIFTIVLMVSVVPKMLEVFADTPEALPTPTKLLLFISGLIEKAWLPLSIFFTAAFFILYRALKKPAHRLKWDTYLLKIPVLGTIIINVQTARFMRTLALLLHAGVPLMEALTASQQVVSNRAVFEKLLPVSQDVKEGSTLHQALAKTRCFNPMSLHMIASGERAGKLEQLIERAAREQEESLAQGIQKGLSLFEPIMILLMGGVVLFIVLAVLLPVFSANPV